MSNAYSGPIRPHVPEELDPPFRGKPTHRCGGKWDMWAEAALDNRVSCVESTERRFHVSAEVIHEERKRDFTTQT